MRRSQRLPSARHHSSSATDPLQAKPEPVSEIFGASVKTHLNKSRKFWREA